MIEDGPQEIIAFVVVREKGVELGVVVVGPDDRPDGTEPALFITVQFFREMFVDMVHKEGKAGMITKVPYKIILLSVLELNVMVQTKHLFFLGDLLERESDKGVVVDLDAVELTGDGEELVPVGCGRLDAINVVEFLSHIESLLDVELGL